MYMHANKLVIDTDNTHIFVMAGHGAAAARRMEVEV